MSDVATPIRDLRDLGITRPGKLNINWLEPALYEEAIRRGEGRVAKGGALLVETGQHTGRSARDKFTVRDPNTEGRIWWDFNASMTPQHFDALWTDMRAHMEGRELFVQELFAGADRAHRLNVRVVSELAWHSLFIRHLLRRPENAELEDFAPEFTIVNLPSFRADETRHGTRHGSETVIAINFTEKLVLIGGTSYAGETKKAVFTILNYLLPEKHIMPMHCSVNVGEKGDSAVFFGLSGTGKTTLSADPKRKLIGDDEHGWSENGLFNFEGGCYAKMIRLSKEAEPDIYATTAMWGTVLENVVMDPATRELDLDSAELAENSRGAYPLHYIPNACDRNVCDHPSTLVMLTCDAFGVMPPIARLTPAQAMYHFLSGYTAKVAGTEKGVDEPSATFSTCFGAPFMPRHPAEYGNLLRELIARHGVQCWLVNTGWTGGAYGIGHRMPIRATRTLLNAAIDGSLSAAQFRKDPVFGFDVPVSVPGIDPAILDPRQTWSDASAYDAQALKLADMFVANFEKFETHVDPAVRSAAPSPDAIRAAAE
ncbi:MAG TPA: phosphoenolpyruvate carboxykinase (ATP) [Oceanicaulis sp.]|jgi:phosphoenolpyruvate carboxykinase (ATP)|uniref:Phosphoenolpyruvate carboxykinase (ATP) n=1 Tax=Glycocaulis albus TaxID=1382801 RepID=A0ABQ1XY47_9PROT|nr:phosphoenolpyruvate carboxykinase [Glycocaulis albus]MBV5257535.1 phosphoenolpyruvate carboxykinase [Synechococcus moorigangaii CMS01]GGH06582.1 phosphoenolpyruvate carboxykinase [ATP] [Glycocaulis albus]HCY55929.1 phosphoenolpyruvate carboxykinase (ATP) [Oceanicaulis sp.]